ncbi:hypothetical protein [Desulfopila sp. IMCC35008]|uniref:hypothetical protein n=1 Tax=Desulfopila sp. IMCC35008 TaxID=2653858 RepID=UPI0013D2A96A|nr:hypothetical protein [Desulfopila sp. IMCC35008]
MEEDLSGSILPEDQHHSFNADQTVIIEVTEKIRLISCITVVCRKLARVTELRDSRAE